jgi:hypothetical protein
MNDKLLALRVFVRVAHTGSFSAAGRELDLSQPSVSRTIAALESEVGEALVIRTTRAVTLTEAGNDYLAHRANPGCARRCRSRRAHAGRPLDLPEVGPEPGGAHLCSGRRPSARRSRGLLTVVLARGREGVIAWKRIQNVNYYIYT